MKYYTGVGSRKTPRHIQRQMFRYAEKLAKTGYVLRSGAAEGADYAFEIGCNHAGGKKEIYIPWNGFQSRQSGAPGTFVLDDYPISIVEGAIALAMGVHHNWDDLTRGGKKLHCRNVFQVLGHNIRTPSQFVICWTPGGRIGRGTATAIKIAQAFKVPVYNLGTALGEYRLNQKIEALR
jgi:hypothetical protein